MSSLQRKVTPIPWGIRKDTPKITCAKPCVASCPREQCGKGESEGPTVETPEEPQVSTKHWQRNITAYGLDVDSLQPGHDDKAFGVQDLLPPHS